MNSGKVLIIMIVGVALLASTVAWRHQASRGVQVLKLWGSENAYLIRKASQIRLSTAGEEYDLSQSKGITHARQALITDSSFDWTDSPKQLADSEVTHRLAFIEGDRKFELDLNLDDKAVQGSVGKPVRMGEILTEGLAEFLEEQSGQ